MKKRYARTVAMGMAFAMMGTTAAFAEDNTDTAVPISETETAVPISENAEKEEVKAEATEAFVNQSGKVSSVTKDENGSYQVFIENENGGLRFMVSNSTVVVNREDGKYLTADKLTEGMEISVIYSANSPMGMSMPPFLGQVTAVVANADKGFFTVGMFDEELVNEKAKLQLNISEDTTIQTTLGTKQTLTAEDVKGKDALVFYDVTTRSIPAQTNPSLVLLLEEVKEVVKEEESPDSTEPATEVVALRDTAEEMGFTVTWQGKDKPILVEKEETAIEITVGTTKYVVDEKEMDAKAAAELIDGVLFVSAEVLGK